MTALTSLNRFREKWQVTIVSVAMILLVLIVFWQEDANDEARFQDAQKVTRALRVQDIDRIHAACKDTREFRETFAEFLDQSSRPSSAGVNFSQLKSFADLDEPTKRFLEELASVQSGGTNRVQSIADRYRERFFPLPDCDRNRDEAMARLPD